MLKDRYLTPFVVEDLKDKMVFIGGPRQVGKTTLCRNHVTPAVLCVRGMGPIHVNWL